MVDIFAVLWIAGLEVNVDWRCVFEFHLHLRPDYDLPTTLVTTSPKKTVQRREEKAGLIMNDPLSKFASPHKGGQIGISLRQREYVWSVTTNTNYLPYSK